MVDPVFTPAIVVTIVAILAVNAYERESRRHALHPPEVGRHRNRLRRWAGRPTVRYVQRWPEDPDAPTCNDRCRHYGVKRAKRPRQ